MRYLNRSVAAAAFFIAGSALAQNAGTVTNHAFAIGKGAGTTGFTSALCTSAQLIVGQSAADPLCKTITGDVTITSAGVTAIGATKVTSADLNADVFSTAHSWGGTQTFTAPVLGTPASGTLTNATGLPISTGISGLGTGCATFLGTPSSANLRGCLTDEVGTGAAYFVGGALGTPASGTATNLTGLPLSGLTTQGAFTIVANNTSGAAVPTAMDVTAITAKASPVSADIVLIQDSAASNAFKRTTVGALASAGSVASFNALTGAITTSVVVQKFTTSGTYTPTSGMLHAIIECVGGGGSGGGTNGTAGNTGAGGGGGAGGYSRLYTTAAAIGASKTVTIGAGGAAPTAGSNAGNAGGDTSVGVLCVGKGGSGGGAGSSGSSALGGVGGVAGTGDIASPGQSGHAGFGTTGTITAGLGGMGASSMFGAGGNTTYSTSSNAGNAGLGFGSGGSGAATFGAGASAAGGAGSAGVVIITEYVNL